MSLSTVSISISLHWLFNTLSKHLFQHHLSQFYLAPKSIHFYIITLTFYFTIKSIYFYRITSTFYLILKSILFSTITTPFTLLLKASISTPSHPTFTSLLKSHHCTHFLPLSLRALAVWISVQTVFLKGVV